MIFTVLEQHKLLFKCWLVSNKNQLECQGRSALLSVQFTLDKTADFLLFRNSVGIHYCHFPPPDFSPVPNRHRPFFVANQLKPCEYFAYLLKELLKYPRENIPEELKKMMPWSEALPDSCRKNKTR